MTSPLDVFFALRIDNNHYLNTLYLCFVGDSYSALVDRIPSLAAGVGVVWLCGRLAARIGPVEGRLALLLSATSFLQIQYSSEARGYAPALFFSLLAFDRLQSHLDHPSRRYPFAYWCSAILAVLSHLTAVPFIVALMTWSAVYLVRRRPISIALVSLVRCHALPLAAFALLYEVDVRHLAIGGGPDYRLADVLRQSASLAVGGPAEGELSYACAVLFVGVCLFGFVLLVRRRSDLAVLYALALLLPALLAVVFQPKVLFIRYFLIATALGLLLISVSLAALYRHSLAGRAVALMLLALYVAGNGYSVVELIALGRGDYRSAVLDLAANTQAATIRVTSDHDFRNAMLLRYYARYLPPGRDIQYVDRDSRSGHKPEWLIQHSLDENVPVPTQVEFDDDPYMLHHVFRHAGLSGWRWAVYHRQGPEPR